MSKEFDKEIKEIFEEWDKKRKERLEKAMDRQFRNAVIMVSFIIGFILIALTLSALFPVHSH